MASDVWLHRDEHFTDGGELFRSARRFSVWAYTVSHSQLLLRSGPIILLATRRPGSTSC